MKTSKGLRKWRKSKKRGAIMKPSTFEKIKKEAGGGKKGEKIAGAAYWMTAKSKYKKRKKRAT